MNEPMDFLTPILLQGDIESFAGSKVNLTKEKRDAYLKQLGIMRDNLERYMGEHESLAYEKSFISGSIAKGTALKTINDLDLAIYLKSTAVSSNLSELLIWIRDNLRKTYPSISKEKIYIDEPCVVVEYTGLDVKVEVMPVISKGDDQDRGYIWDRFSKGKTETSIPLQLAFIRKRKANNSHFGQVVRLLKWWGREKQLKDHGLGSYSLELIAAYVLDKGCNFMDYHEGLIGVFSWLKNSQLAERIAFTDYYKASSLPAKEKGVELFDPVDPNNNLGSNINSYDQTEILKLAGESLDALVFSKSAQNKYEAINCWKQVMGQGFTV